MKLLRKIIILIVFAFAYIISVIYLDNVKILAGNITPFVNIWALVVLVTLGSIAGIFLIKFSKHTDPFLYENKVDANKRHIYLLLAILILSKLFAFFLSPGVLQYMWVWPDGAGFLSDMQIVLKDPFSIFQGRMKSPLYTTWLTLNHLAFSRIMGPPVSQTYFGYPVFLNDIVPPLILQNIIGILSGLICFSILSRVNIKFAWAVTLLAFINPTTFATDNSLLRESLALFFVLGAFALFLKAVRQENFIYSVVSGILFVLAYQTRPELIIIYIVLCCILFIHNLFRKQKIWKAVILFCLPLVLSVFFTNNLSYEYAVSTNKGRFGIAMHGLKSRCYSYKSPTFPVFIENMQKRLKQLEYERKAPCDAPASTWQLVWFATDEEKAKYNQSLTGEGLGKFTKIESDDQIFVDIVRYNTFCYIQSLLANIGYNLIHNVENMSPILYDGNDYWIAQNWTYYTSPKMLVLYEKNKPYHKYIVALFRTIELYTTRKILLPFFFIGSIMILNLTKRGLFADGSSSNLLLISILVISWIHLSFVSVMGYPAARFIYVLVPFIFAVEIMGVMGIYYWLKSQVLK